MRAIGVDSAGLIWTAGVASRADWRAAWRDMPRLQPGETSWAPDEQMLLRTVVEVIDTRSRSLLSTTSLLGSARVFLDRNRLAVYTVQNDVPRVAIIELRLLQQDQ
jgi:hypothetical protein